MMRKVAEQGKCLFRNRKNPLPKYGFSFVNAKKNAVLCSVNKKQNV
jgi:hypothetical protein